MKKEITTNTFTDGLMMDLNPLITPNNVLTNCLNGTLITYNGNEHMLQNDMGNGRVETAMLPAGYIPLGTVANGGFVYIVSYNPLTNLAQIGSFPSPERNIDTTEMKDTTTMGFELKDITIDGAEITFPDGTYYALKPLVRKIFDLVELNPGDKFIVFANDLYSNYLSDFNANYIDATPRLWKIRIAGVLDNKTEELENLKWYDTGIEKGTEESNSGKYYIKQLEGDLRNRGNEKVDIDEYRSLVNGAYSIYNSKKSGKLALLISPECPETFSASWSAYKPTVIDEKANLSKVITKLEYFAKLQTINPDIFSTVTSTNKVKKVRESEENTSETPAGENALKKATEDNEVYDLYINSSWDNLGRDVNPEGVFVRIKGDLPNGVTILDSQDKNPNYYKIPFKCSRMQSESTGYKSAEKRLQTLAWYNRYNTEKDNKTLVDNKIIHKIYSDGCPELDREGRSKYYIGVDYTGDTDLWGNYSSNEVKDNKGGYWEGAIEDDFINNVFHLDVSYKLGSIIYPSGIPEDSRDYIIELEVIPYTEAGYFPHLAKTLTINLAKLGKLHVKLTKWKYYILEDSEIINWLLDAYAQQGELISKVWMEFYDNLGLCATYTLDGLSSYNGEFLTVFNFGTYTLDGYNSRLSWESNSSRQIIEHCRDRIDGITINNEIIEDTGNNLKLLSEAFGNNLDKASNYQEQGYVCVKTMSEVLQLGDLTDQDLINPRCYVNDSGLLYKNLVYGVKIRYEISKLSTFNDGEKTTADVATRWLWTAPVFNSQYDTTDDFEKLKPELQLDINVNYGSTANYKALKVNYSQEGSTIYIPKAGESYNPTELLGANLLYISGNDNVEAVITLGVSDNYGTFRFNEECIPDCIQLQLGIGKQGIRKSIEQPKVIQESTGGDINKLNSDDNITNDPIQLSPVQGQLLSLASNSNITELWGLNAVHNNKYLFTYSGTPLGDSQTYYSVISEKDENLLLISISKAFSSKGVCHQLFTFNALHYSKYYTIASGSLLTGNFKIVRPLINSEADLINYGLKLQNNLAYFHKFIGIGADKANDGGKIRTLLGDGTVGNWDGSTDESGASSRNTGFLVNINWVGEGEKHKNSWTYADIIRRNSDKVQEIAQSFTGFFPVITRTYHNGRSTRWDLSDDGKFKKDNKKLFGREGYNLRNNEYLEYSASGGCFGCVSGNTIACDLSNQCASYRNNSWANTLTIPRRGSAFTFYAELILSMLTHTLYKTSDTRQLSYYSLDNYTYYEPYTTNFISDVVYKVDFSSTSEKADNILIMGLTSDGGGLDYSKYVSNIQNKITISNDNIDFEIKGIVKNCPIEFAFDYIQPEIIKNDLSNKALLRHFNIVNKLIDCDDDDVLYHFDKDSLEISVLNETSLFTPVKSIGDNTINYDSTTINRCAYLLKDNSNETILGNFTMPILEDTSIFEIKSGKLTINQSLAEKVMTDTSMIIETSYVDGDKACITNIPKLEFFKFVNE